MFYDGDKKFRNEMNDYIRKNFANVLGDDVQLLDTNDYDTLRKNVRTRLEKY